MNTSELQGAALDWAVATCEGLLCNGYEDDMGLIRIPSLENEYYAPSMKWAQGGPIIERDKLDVFCSGNVWDASTGDRHPNVIKTGPTPLIAAMRCYVASKLGDEIELPEELK